MKQPDPIYIYSETKLQEFKFGKSVLYLQGKPIQTKTSIKTDDWIKSILKSLNKTNIIPEKELGKIFKSSTGSFSFVLKTEYELIIAGDIIRSYPLFYGFHQNKVFVTDNLEKFQKENGTLEKDLDRFEEFFTTGLVYGNKTIYKNVYGLQAGEIITIRANKINSERYFVFKPADNPVYYEKLNEFAKDFDKLFIFVFSRMIKQNNDVNQWVIPLSGGHDSRLIVNYLYRLGIKNVICFSYGTPDNEQSRISKQVAQAVGYDWYFVEYTEQKWEDLHNNGLFDQYIRFAFNGVSTPHLQDFLAVYELKAKKIIQKGDIFLPGHTMITIDDFDENTLKLKTEEESLNYVYSKIRTMGDISLQKSSFYPILKKLYYESKTKPENFMAYCDWQENKCKYLVNSIRVYEFFGFESLLPMWEKEMPDFWLTIPDYERISRKPLYDTEKLCGLVEQLTIIPYADETRKSTNSRFSSSLKKLIPNSLLVYLLGITRRKVKLNEGLNQIYSLKAKSVKQLLEPIKDFPEGTIPYFKPYLDRFTFQMNPNILTTLYTIRKLMDRNKRV